jgi:hypothetical protein
MWPHALWSNNEVGDGAEPIAVIMLNVTGLALSVVAVVAYAHGWPPPAARVAELARTIRRTSRRGSRRLIALGQKAFLRYADHQADVLTGLADTVKRTADRVKVPLQRRDPRLG